MHKKALLACMLVVTMLLSGCALIEKDPVVDAQTEIIRVGDTVFTKGEIQDQVNYQLSYMAYLYQMYGMSFDTTDAANIADAQDAVIDSLVEQAVQDIKAKELGLDVLTAEEETTLAEEVESTWQSNRDSVKSNYFADTELTGDELEAAIDEQIIALGVTKESVEEQERATMARDKLREYVIKDVVVTEEELQAAFDEQVATATTNYESNLSAYGTAVNNGTTVYYRPAGYRMVKQILVQFTDEDQAVIDDLNSKISAANNTITSLTTELTDAGVEDVDALTAKVTVTMEQPAAVEASATADANAEVTTPSDLAVVSNLATVTDVATAFDEGTAQDVADLAEQLAVAKAELAFYQEQLDAATANAFKNIDAEADDILTQLADGADWDTLMAEKTDDPGMQGDTATAKNGYAVCEGFSSFDTAFTTAAMALEKVGDVSPKTKGSYGYYIIQYTADVEEGPVPLDDVREELTASTLTTKQNTTFDEQLATWVTEANAKIDRNALKD